MIIALVAPLVVSGFVKRKSEIVGVGRLFKLSIHLQKEKKKRSTVQWAWTFIFGQRRTTLQKHWLLFSFLKLFYRLHKYLKTFFFSTSCALPINLFFFLLVFSLMLKVLLLLFYFGKITRYHFKLCSRLHFAS